jgi:plastocyanin
MKKSVVISIVVVIVLLAAGGLLFANLGSDSDSTKETTSKTNMVMDNSNSSSTESTSAVATDKVEIKDFSYSPQAITVKVGTTVTWTNKDSVAHTVTASNGPEKFDSGSIETGKTFTFTFTKAGDYKYFCTFHPSMASATVTVTE